jgi:hypothetical protein
MPPLSTSTRKQLRRIIGERSGHMEIRLLTSSGSTTTGVDVLLPGSDDEHNGKFFAQDTDEFATVTDFVSSTTTLTLSPAVTSTTAGEYELWSHDWDPLRVNRLIDDAVQAAINNEILLYDLDETLFGHVKERKLALPSGLKLLDKIYVRNFVTMKEILPSRTAWDAYVDAQVTASQDTEDVRENGASAKFTWSSGISNGNIIASDSMSAVDLTRYDSVEFWIKVTSAVAAGDLELLLDNTALAASPLETIELPAIAARTWTRVRLSLVTPELDSAIISVALEYDANAKANTIWINKIVGIAENESVYGPEPLDQWDYNVDREAGEIHFTPRGLAAISNRRLRFQGYKNPSVPSTDATTVNVDPEFIILHVLAAMEVSLGGPAANDPAGYRQAGMFNNALLLERIDEQPTLQGMLVA